MQSDPPNNSPMVEEIGRSARFDEANAVQRRMRLLAGTLPMA
jgi:hypothetical protein